MNKQQNDQGTKRNDAEHSGGPGPSGSSHETSLRPPQVCGVGEMDESISPAADILVCPVLHSENMLVCSPTLVLSSDKSPNSEAQSVSKPNEGLPKEEIDIGSMVVSSTISERLFEGDLPKGKGPKSCILTAGAKLVAVQSLASLRGDVQPTFLEHELESPDQVPYKVSLWHSRGMREGNQSQVNDPELETVKDTSEIDSVGDNMKYVTRSETQKFMGSTIVASKAHTERTRKRRREGLEPHQPASTPLIIENSETESEDAVKYVAKKRRETEEKKGEKERKQLEEQPVKGPGPRVKYQIEEKKLTREERVEKMEQQRVLNGRVFDPDILTTFGMANLVDVVTIQGWNHLFEPQFHTCMNLKNVQIHLDEETLGIILGVSVAEFRTIEGCKPTDDFSKLSTKQGDVKRAGLPKKFLKGSIS
ncbi:hypothetical protein H5410_062171 [Solanum commersonii]|uniref:Uncharacterized protein n=1 Tax=Solanum commersonii TaxID=4109 RepID=A0A9J5WA35_SOLCO|nr:hypothetical protein H5410_062171 [Solanum commersonii]